MILSRKLSDALNEQINMEMWSSNLYLSMSVHFTQIGLDGFAHWTLKQSQEELEHAYKMIDYSIKRGGQVTIGVVNSVPTAWGDTKGFDYFKENHLTDFQAEKGNAGVFYLHPNEKGAVRLGELWSEAIRQALGL